MLAFVAGCAFLACFVCCLFKAAILVPLTIKTRHVAQYVFLKSGPRTTSLFSLFRNRFNKRIHKYANTSNPQSAFILKPGNSILGQLELTELSQIGYDLLLQLKDQEFDYFELESGDYLSIEFSSSLLTPLHTALSSVKLRRFTKGQITECLQLRQGSRVTVVGQFKCVPRSVENQ